MEVNEATKDIERKARLVNKQLVEETKISAKVVAKVTFEEADGIIVLLDALGIKGIWNRKNPAEVLNTWAALQEEYTKGIESLRNEFTAHGYIKRPWAKKSCQICVKSDPTTCESIHEYCLRAGMCQMS